MAETHGGDRLEQRPVDQNTIRTQLASRLLARAARVGQEVITAAMEVPDSVGVIALNAQIGAMEGLAAAAIDPRLTLTAEDVAPVAGVEVADWHPLDASASWLSTQVGPSAEM